MRCLQAFNIALNNLSLVLITLSLNQVIRCGLGVIDPAWPQCQPASLHRSCRRVFKRYLPTAHPAVDIIPLTLLCTPSDVPSTSHKIVDAAAF